MPSSPATWDWLFFSILGNLKANLLVLFNSADLISVGSSQPYDAPGTIQSKESDTYNNSLLGNLLEILILY